MTAHVSLRTPTVSQSAYNPLRPVTMAASAPSGAFTPDEPGALSLDEVLQQVSQDDQEEWEYEYSTTETETYYLTVELSYPEFKERTHRAPHHSRGGYYKNWQDQSSADPATIITRSKQGNEGALSDDDNDDEPEGEGEGEGDDDVQPLDPVLEAKGKAVDTGNTINDKDKEKGQETGDGDDEEEDDSESMEDIQILDLHSHNPIISYRGRVFEGQWAEVIGTEAILANHDEENPLPALRNLAEGVDILGASASRIMTTEKVPKPKVPDEDTLAPIREEWNIRIPPGKDRTGERALQIRFLENLIALKKKRGEQDQVTVYATDGAGKNWNDRQGPDYKPRIRKKAGPGDENEDGEGRRRGRRGAAGRGRARGGRRRRGARGGAESPTEMVVLSTPTPSQWDDVSRPDDDFEPPDFDEDDEDGDDSDEEGAEDVSMAGYE
ncbi:Uncharacterized protein TPAR_05113 [Tolypocladium paradoxum]|uniref:Transcription factor TFIIIC triple barrel domain-containing protein n=1 Tax=Tolypocladium paradoxum TaxID=94208 RepID=A0A2S4KWX3_9HYPO|nr:Uncharacterized protein TPAR_05113 [Tolypocladium paradoxum]